MTTEADGAREVSLTEAMQMAIAAQQHGNLDAAEAIYTRILGAWPECADALHFLGLLTFQRGSPKEGLQLVARALALAPEHPDIWNNYGNLLKALENNTEAAGAYRQAIALRPDFADAHSNLGTIFEQDEQLEKAEEAYRNALAADPSLIQPLLNLGALLEKRGQHAEAGAAYEKAIALKPADPRAYGCLGHLLWQQGKQKEATELIVRNSELNPGDPRAYVVLGGIFWEQQRVDECIEAYQRAIALDPRYAHANRLLAHVFNLLGRKTEALEVWRKWIAIEPDNPVPRHLLAANEGGDIPTRAADDFVVKEFDRFAEAFDAKLHNLKYQAPQLAAAAFAAEFGEPRSGLDILDAGCGTGLCAPLLRPFARCLDGVDLSSSMLAKARERGGYDELHEAELTAFLASLHADYDAIVSTDTLCYFGDLTAAVRAAAGALRPGGVLIFTAEKMETAGLSPGFTLNFTGRYSHTEDYVRAVLSEAGFEIRSIEQAVLRLEYRRPVDGLVVVGRRFSA